MLFARACLLVSLVLLAGCGGDDGEAPGPVGNQGFIEEVGPQHVHGLGVNPADGVLYSATHTGLWSAPEGETRARRVADVYHDLMGFTVAGPDEFLASGHPGAQADLPPQLGLQRSTDGGRSWEPVSLLGEADLHVLRVAGERIYAVDSATGAFLMSADAGRTWQERDPPAPAFDLAIAPDQPKRLIAATERGLLASADTGRTWRRVRGDMAGLLAWPSAGSLYLVDAQGTVSRSADGGRTFERVGEIGGQPEAFAGSGARELYAAVHGEVVMSTDGGESWSTRAGL